MSNEKQFTKEDALSMIAASTKGGLKGILGYQIPTILKNISLGAGKQVKKRYMNGISYYLFQPMYSQTGASICNYLKSLDPKKYSKVADRWMRGVRTDAWFLKPYAMFFKSLGNNTFIFARSIVEPDGGCAIEMYIIGRDMFREIDRLTMFEKKMSGDNDKILQINVSTSKDGNIISSNDGILARNLDTIYMNHDSKIDLIKFIDRWRDNKELYRRSNIVYKIGILLYGQPGTGKTSLVKALSTYYHATIININPNDIATSSIGEIKTLIESSTEGLKIVLLEDIDVVMKTTREDNDTADDRKTMNGVMQLLDGTLSVDNTIFIATTNYIDRLDPAIIRAGRFDKKVEMNNIDKDTAEEMCKGFKVNPETFLANKNFPINPSLLQDELIKHVFANKIGDDGEIDSNEKSSDIVAADSEDTDDLFSYTKGVSYNG